MHGYYATNPVYYVKLYDVLVFGMKSEPPARLFHANSLFGLIAGGKFNRSN